MYVNNTKANFVQVVLLYGQVAVHYQVPETEMSLLWDNLDQTLVAGLACFSNAWACSIKYFKSYGSNVKIKIFILTSRVSSETKTYHQERKTISTKKIRNLIKLTFTVINGKISFLSALRILAFHNKICKNESNYKVAFFLKNIKNIQRQFKDDIAGA